MVSALIKTNCCALAGTRVIILGAHPVRTDQILIKHVCFLYWKPNLGFKKSVIPRFASESKQRQWCTRRRLGPTSAGESILYLVSTTRWYVFCVVVEAWRHSLPWGETFASDWLSLWSQCLMSSPCLKIARGRQGASKVCRTSCLLWQFAVKVLRGFSVRFCSLKVPL